MQETGTGSYDTNSELVYVCLNEGDQTADLWGKTKNQEHSYLCT